MGKCQGPIGFNMVNASLWYLLGLRTGFERLSMQGGSGIVECTLDQCIPLLCLWGQCENILFVTLVEVRQKACRRLTVFTTQTEFFKF